MILNVSTANLEPWALSGGTAPVFLNFRFLCKSAVTRHAQDNLGQSNESPVPAEYKVSCAPNTVSHFVPLFLIFLLLSLFPLFSFTFFSYLFFFTCTSCLLYYFHIFNLLYCVNPCKWPTLCTIIFFLYLFIPVLYMFRATKCSSSGESVVSIRPLVCVTVCRWPFGVQVWMEPAYHTVTYIEWQRSYWYSWLSWRWAHGCSKHVENWNKQI